MLRFCDKLLRVNNNCVVRAARTSSQRRRAQPTQVTKFNGQKTFTNNGPNREGKFKSFMQESTLFDKNYENEDEFDFSEDEDYDDRIMNAHKSYNEYLREEKKRNKFVVQKIVKRKYFKDPKEPTLLTWAAKEQLRYLHDTDAETWTPEKLSESFPISVNGVKKLLSNKHRVQSQEKIQAHDKAVYECWKQLRKDGGPILAALNKKFPFHGPNFDSAKPNSNLPVPDETWQMQHNPPKNNMAVKSNADVGEFESMIVRYKALCTKPEDNSKQLTMASPGGEVAAYDASHSEEMDVFPAQATVPRNARKQVTFNEFKKNMQHHLLKESVDNPEPYQKFKAWFEENDTSKTPPAPISIDELYEDPVFELFEGKIQKYKEDALPGLKWDVHRDTKNPQGEEAYLYDPDHGYQRPYGRFEDDSRVEIPTSKQKEGGLYRKGNCYYDDSGELVYRVPFLLEE